MRRSRLMIWALVAAMMLATVPTATAEAAKPSPSTYTVFMTICDFAQVERDAGPTAHYGGSWHTGNEFVLIGTQWVLSGTFRVDMQASNWGPSSGTASGTFAVRDSLLGDYDGNWAWNGGQGDDGHGVGQGVGTSKGDHLKVDFLLNDPVGLPGWPADWCGGAPAYGHRYLVMSTY